MPNGQFCGMCGSSKIRRLIKRVARPEDRWLVCDDCASEMLSKPELAGVWEEVVDAEVVHTHLRTFRKSGAHSLDYRGKRAGEEIQRGSRLRSSPVNPRRATAMGSQSAIVKPNNGLAPVEKRTRPRAISSKVGCG